MSDVENTRKRNDFRGKFYILFHPARVIQTHVGGSLRDKDAHRRHATNGAMKAAKLQDEIPKEIMHGKKKRMNNTIWKNFCFSTILLTFKLNRGMGERKGKQSSNRIILTGVSLSRLTRSFVRLLAEMTKSSADALLLSLLLSFEIWSFDDIPSSRRFLPPGNYGAKYE